MRLNSLHTDQSGRTHALTRATGDASMGVRFLEAFEFYMTTIGGRKLEMPARILDRNHRTHQASHRHPHSFHQTPATFYDFLPVAHTSSFSIGVPETRNRNSF